MLASGVVAAPGARARGRTGRKARRAKVSGVLPEPRASEEPEAAMQELAKRKAAALAEQLDADAAELAQAGHISAANAVQRAADIARRLSNVLAEGADQNKR